jgi:single-stranded-DNA-specific exonuclease
MTSLDKRWQVAASISPQAIKNLEDYSPILRQILFNRGISTHEQAQTYLNPDQETHDPMLLLGMESALTRIEQALKNDEKIIIYGDYDADGVTSSALLTHTFRALGADVEVYIPHRFNEGYGLNLTALDKLKAKGADLIITVDCGIRAVPQSVHAREIGVDLIITDHHTTGDELPEAAAIINPKQPDDPYPEKQLAGVGVAYKLACALIKHLAPSNLQEEDLLDLVAIGTVADLVPLIGENRLLVRKGLERIRTMPRQGVVSLCGVAGIKPQAVGATEIGFGLGPRINAAGRIGSAKMAYELLTTQEVSEAGNLAQILDNRNRERRKITKEIQDQCEEMVLEDGEPPLLLFTYHKDFSPGVVGLAASRLVEKYYRPAIIGYRGEDYTRASCRSIKEFHITQALESCADLLTQFGGHAAAAGFTVKNENVSKLVERLNTLAEESLDGKDLRPVLNADAEVKLFDLKPALISEMDQMQPTGYGNPEAVFVSRRVEVRNSRTVGRDNSHLKLTVSDGRITYDAIAFRLGHWHENIPPYIDLLFTFEVNEYNGRRTLQLNVKDIKKPGSK